MQTDPTAAKDLLASFREHGLHKVPRGTPLVLTYHAPARVRGTPHTRHGPPVRHPVGLRVCLCHEAAVPFEHLATIPNTSPLPPPPLPHTPSTQLHSARNASQHPDRKGLASLRNGRLLCLHLRHRPQEGGLAQRCVTPTKSFFIERLPTSSCVTLFP